jgi:histidyl-tRNA synthetase
MKYAIAPGVFDIIPQDPKNPWKSSYLWTFVESIIRDTANQFGFREIRTPVFERTELFVRSVGETSDIVSKEMYTFEDKGKRSMSLRPEGTAPTIRAFIENQLNTSGPVQKLFYLSSMFRYERSQAGRYRQHHQFGAEAIGLSSPEQDAEVIDLLYTVYRRLGLVNVRLMINSIGDTESRLAFRKALQDYLRPHLSELSEDSQRRFDQNPLRILDSKDPKDQKLVKQAPCILEFLSDEERDHFEQLKKLLDILDIPYQVNPLLVRGLDYYNKTVFEVVTDDLGAQNSIGGGGRYDGLIASLGGPNLPASGFGTGIERVIQTMMNQQVALPRLPTPILYMIPLGEAAKKPSFTLLHNLRQLGLAVEMDFTSKKLPKMMQQADQMKAQFVMVIGDKEINSGEIELKEMATGIKTKVLLKDLPAILSIQAKSKNLLSAWEEMSHPFQSEGQTHFFAEKVETAIKETNEFAEQIKNTLEKMKFFLGQY